MTTVHEINLEDITIADKYLNGHNPQRCKNALWSAYNVLKKMKNASVSKGVYDVLVAVCKNSDYNSEKDAFKYTAVNFADFPIEQHHYVIEDYGFTYSNFVFTDNYKPKGRPKLARAKHFTLSYTKDDFTDVIFGLKLFADICQKHSWPFFANGDIRVAFKNAEELRLSLGQREGNATVKEICDYFLTDAVLKNGTERLLELASELKIKNRFVASDSCTFIWCRGNEQLFYKAVHRT